jgi:GTP cyclohydrolase I
VKLVEWLAKAVTDDPRALRWFAEEGSDDRIARAFKELLAGYEVEPSTILKTTRMLEPGERPGLVEVKGLGKLPRLVDCYARRFQIQEDLVRQVAREMMDSGHARGVRVRSRAQHLCMCSRGPASQSAVTHTEFSLGTLAED